MKDDCVACLYSAGIGDDFVGVMNIAINHKAPGLVADDSSAMPAGGVCRIAVAVKDGGCVVVRHDLLPGAGSNEGAVLAKHPSKAINQRLR